MRRLGACEHCGELGGTTNERLLFEGAGRELTLELCGRCRREIVAEEGIRPRIDA